MAIKKIEGSKDKYDVVQYLPEKASRASLRYK
jgi:hypothetical protein